MDKPVANVQSLSLSELNLRIKHAMRDLFPGGYWVVAEISELKVNAAGHCYLELIEKDSVSDKIIAKARGNIWAYTFRLLKPYFDTTARRPLSAGLKVLVFAQVEFHEVYGYNLNITDIDPAYTLGDLARQRAETIARLQSDGVFDMNRSLELPAVAQKIAIVSSPTAAGYGDFTEHIMNNEYGYHFYLKLFPAIVQGEEAVESIISALDKINSYSEFFDVVVIIRGGGAQSDLSCFDNYWLASHVSQFPLPILTGIGHEQDESVVDLVANTRLKTPTAVADFLISRTAEFEEYVNDLQSQLIEEVKHRMNELKSDFVMLGMKLAPRVRETLRRKERNLAILSMQMPQEWIRFHMKRSSYLNKLKIQAGSSISHTLNMTGQRLGFSASSLWPAIHRFLRSHKSETDTLEELTLSLDPVNVLKRGFSITYLNRKLLKNSREARLDDILTTQLHKGRVKSKIIDAKNPES